MADETKIILGSGKLYFVALDEDGDIPANYEYDDGDCVGDIQGGAELSYKPTIKEVKNDFGEIRKAFITAEEVSLKSGVLTWDLNNMAKFTVGANYQPVSKTITIGGKKEITQYAIFFVHENDDGSKIEISLKGYNGSGWTLSFKPEDETVVDVEIKATHQSNKTLVSIKEIAAA